MLLMRCFHSSCYGALAILLLEHRWGSRCSRGEYEGMAKLQALSADTSQHWVHSSGHARPAACILTRSLTSDTKCLNSQHGKKKTLTPLGVTITRMTSTVSPTPRTLTSAQAVPREHATGTVPVLGENPVRTSNPTENRSLDPQVWRCLLYP